MNSNAPALRISGLKVYFPIRKGIVGKIAGHVKAVDDVSFTVEKQEAFAVVGESGCGKTTIAQAILNLVSPTAGTIAIGAGPWESTGVEWRSLTSSQQRALRKHIQVIFQDPFSSLSPRMSVRAILEEPLTVHGVGSRQDRADRIAELMKQVGMSPDFLRRYPHEFSGGQRQRIGIARALATRPSIIIADEPVSALDVSIQAQIINLLQDLQEQYHQTLVFISHDLSLVRHIAQRIAVVYMGRIMEMGTTDQVFGDPRHPYTHLLLASVPVPGKGRARRSLPTEEKCTGPADGSCPFYPRCGSRGPECLAGRPALQDVGEGHFVACIKSSPA